ncbi:helix-turn-helix domain-containing protein [Marinicella sp. W31]|uniref:helix-turn-helix domain-containing protein n=1 Tax=Marinicella sp. W31 TaxID=3023713 RepID=UPI0037578EA1
MTINLYNLIILIATVHGLTLSGLLILSKNKPRKTHMFLALVLIFYTLPVLKSILIDIGFFTSHALSLLPLELIYGLGPSLYLYTRTVSDPGYQLRKVDLLHFVPVALELIYYLTPSYQSVPYYSFGKIQNAHHLIWMLQQSGGIASILIYLGLSLRLLIRYSRWVQDNYSDMHHKNLRWLQKPVILYTVFFALWFALRGVDIFYFQDNLDIRPYYPLLIILSVITYWIGTKGYLQAHIKAMGYSQAQQPVSDGNNSQDSATLATLYAHVQKVMQDEQLFLHNGLTLTDLSQHTNINPRLLSQVINTQAKVNFYQYINQFRLNIFKQKLQQMDASKGIFDLALECGFNSKTTFNQIFKTDTGMTPSEFKKQIQDA